MLSGKGFNDKEIHTSPSIKKEPFSFFACYVPDAVEDVEGKKKMLGWVALDKGCGCCTEEPSKGLFWF